MPRRSPLYILLLASLLVGLVAWLTVTVYAGGRADFEFPGEPDSPLAQELPGFVAQPLTAGKDAKEVHLRVEIHPTARLLGEDTTTLPVRVRDGDREISARVEAIAGAYVGARRPDGPGRTLFKITLADGAQLWRVSNHGAFVEGSEIPITLTPASSFRGIVRDEQGRPVPNAELVCDSCTTTSDRDGRFELALPRGGVGIPLLVRASGKADAWQQLDLVQTSNEPVAVAVSESEPVLVRVAGPAREGVGQVIVLPGSEVDTRVLRYPFWQQAAQPFVLDSAGSCTLVGLPKGVALRIVVSHPGLLVRVPADLRVGINSSEPLLVVAEAAATLRGRVLDAQRRPIPGAMITSRGSDADLPRADLSWLLPPLAALAEVSSATSDARGYFALARRHTYKGESLVRVVASGCLGLEVKVADARNDLDHEFALPSRGAEASGAPTLALALATRGRKVSCTLVEKGRHLRNLTGSDSEPLLIALREPCLVDLRAEVDGGASTAKSWFGLAVMGRTALVLDDQ